MASFTKPVAAVLTPPIRVSTDFSLTITTLLVVFRLVLFLIAIRVPRFVSSLVSFLKLFSKVFIEGTASVVQLHHLVGGESLVALLTFEFVFVGLVMPVVASTNRRPKGTRGNTAKALILLLQRFLTFPLVFYFVFDTLLPIFE